MSSPRKHPRWATEPSPIKCFIANLGMTLRKWMQGRPPSWAIWIGDAQSKWNLWLTVKCRWCSTVRPKSSQKQWWLCKISTLKKSQGQTHRVKITGYSPRLGSHCENRLLSMSTTIKKIMNITTITASSKGIRNPAQRPSPTRRRLWASW